MATGYPRAVYQRREPNGSWGNYSHVSFNPNIANLSPVQNLPICNADTFDSIKIVPKDYSSTYYATPYTPQLPPFRNVSVLDYLKTLNKDYSFETFSTPFIVVPVVTTPPIVNSTVDSTKTLNKNDSWVSFNQSLQSLPPLPPQKFYDNFPKVAELPRPQSWTSFNSNIPVINRPFNQYNYPLPLPGYQVISYAFNGTVLIPSPVVSNNHFLLILGVGQ